MTMEKIREKTQKVRAKTRRAMLGWIVTPLLVSGICGWGIAQVNGGLVVRVVFAFAIAWSLAGQYFLKRGVWSATLPRDAALSTGLESYRREVERRRYISGHFLLWSLAPVVLALATFIVPLLNLGSGKGMLFNMIPFLVLLVIWIAGVFVLRVRDQRELQREIDELDDIERENRR